VNAEPHYELTEKQRSSVAALQIESLPEMKLCGLVNIKLQTVRCESYTEFSFFPHSKNLQFSINKCYLTLTQLS